jgi:poly(hydroxyalkanoate) granule-associated protein
VSSRVERGRSELEELIDLAVERALNRLSIPTRRDLEALNARLDTLEARLARLAAAEDGDRGPSTRPRTGARVR